MVFSTPLFLFWFLPLCLLAYFAAPRGLRNGVLLGFSLLFYFWGERIYAVLMVISTLLDYGCGLMVAAGRRRGDLSGARRGVAISVCGNLALLGFFKYWDFLAGALGAAGIPLLPVLGIHLPIGISFYTFQTMSYTIDVYRGDTPVQRSLLNFGVFVTLFPQLIAGPIVKYRELGPQLDDRSVTLEDFSAGAGIFTVGLAKKLLLANGAGQLWERYKALPPGGLTLAGAWLGIVAFAIQIYFDFSGYSDMATGLGRMLGFRFPINFNYPYTARSVADFWRRWHISLSSWFREYLYLPLGGSRCSRPKWMRNLFLVWAATGIWHGASWNYLIWGLYFFLLLLLEKLWLGRFLSRLPPAVGHLYTLGAVLVSWAIFALEDFSHLGSYLRVLFGLGHVPLADGTFFYYALSYLPLLLAAGVASTPLGKTLFLRLSSRRAGWAAVGLTLTGLVVCTAYLVDASYNPFLYFRF